MLARSFWLILAVVVTAAPVKAEPIKIAYSGVSAAGTPLWLAKEKGSSPGMDWRPTWSP